MKRLTLVLTILAFLAGCGTEDAATGNSDAKASAVEAASMTAKPQGPVIIDYRIIGAPIVGQPLGIDIEVRSLLGPQQITLSYRINDSTAMEFSAAQPAQVTIAPSSAATPSLQQVRLVPLREGRLFLNVVASVEVDGSTMSTAMAIPIQVGAAARQIEENGTLGTDESGAAIRSLPATED
jgi:hypothetical protein